MESGERNPFQTYGITEYSRTASSHVDVTPARTRGDFGVEDAYAMIFDARGIFLRCRCEPETDFWGS